MVLGGRGSMCFQVCFAIQVQYQKGAAPKCTYVVYCGHCPQDYALPVSPFITHDAHHKNGQECSERL